MSSTFSNTLLTVRIKNSVGTTVKLGSLIVGSVTKLGTLEANPTVGIIDYSRKDTDAFGNFTFVQRNFSKRLSAQVFIDNSQLNGVQRFLNEIRATPSVWIGSEDPSFEESLVIYGFYRDFNIAIPYPQTSLCQLEIEGLT